MTTDESKKEEPKKGKARRIWWLIGLLAIAVVIVALFIWLPGFSPPGTDAATLTAQASSSEAPPVSGERATQTPTEEPTTPPPATATTTPEGTPIYTPTIAIIGTITVEDTEARTGPGIGYPVIMVLKRGTTLRVIGVNPERTWFLVLLPDDRQGWVPVESLEIDFDMDILPEVPGEPVPTDDGPAPYGQGMLVPPDLSGVAPAAASNPMRKVLALIAASWLALLVASAYSLRRRPAPPRPSLARLLQMIASML